MIFFSLSTGPVMCSCLFVARLEVSIKSSVPNATKTVVGDDRDSSLSKYLCILYIWLFQSCVDCKYVETSVHHICISVLMV